MELKILYGGNNVQLRVLGYVHRIHMGKDISKIMEYFYVGTWTYIWREIIDSFGYVATSI